jgi:hypothetical protein
MRPIRQPLRPGKDVLFLAILIALGALVIGLWLADASHKADEKSRVPWPDGQSGKP